VREASEPHSSRKVFRTMVKRLGGCERGTALRDLESLAKFQAVGALQVDAAMRLGRKTVGATEDLRRKVRAIFAGKAQTKASRLAAQLLVDSTGRH
jgi:hypothetical protein